MSLKEYIDKNIDKLNNVLGNTVSENEILFFLMGKLVLSNV